MKKKKMVTMKHCCAFAGPGEEGDLFVIPVQGVSFDLSPPVGYLYLMIIYSTLRVSKVVDRLTLQRICISSNGPNYQCLGAFDWSLMRLQSISLKLLTPVYQLVRIKLFSTPKSHTL